MNNAFIDIIKNLHMQHEHDRTFFCLDSFFLCVNVLLCETDINIDMKVFCIPLFIRISIAQ